MEVYNHVDKVRVQNEMKTGKYHVIFEPFPIIGRGFLNTILYQILYQMKEKR